MLNALKLVATAAIYCAIMAMPALSANPYFELKVSPEATAIPVGADDYAAIGRTEISTTIFALGNGEHKVKGVLMRDLLKYFGGKGEVVKLTALDGYAMDIPVTDFETYDAVIATEIDGQPLTIREHGPAWLLYPASGHPELIDTVYESRAVWQIKTIEID